MTEFKICGVKIRIDFSFLVFISLLFLIKNGSMIFCFFTVCLVHELGHAIALNFVGGKLSALYFCGMGIKMIPQHKKILSVKSDAIVLLAGPLSNLVVFVAFTILNRNNSFALLNLCAAVFNLLPYSALDGGALIKLIFSDIAHEKKLKTAMLFLHIVFIALSIYITCTYGYAFLPLLCAAVFYFFNELK